MKINKLLTPYNHNDGNINRIKYIVIHYVGATGSAEANCKWYAQGNRGASAHYFVNFDGEIWQSVEDKDIAWSVGGNKYPNTSGGTFYGKCTNSNSLNIEMCVRNKGNQSSDSKDWYFEDATVNTAIELTKMLMKKYNVPVENVIRHYDVVGKICPNPYVYNHTKHTWNDFKKALVEEPKKSGWYQEDGGWRFYLGNTGDCVRDAWYKDGEKWYWFRNDGLMVHDVWYSYNGNWYYLGSDGAMKTGLQTIEGKWYYLNEDGTMATEPVLLTPDDNGALQYPGLLVNE